MSIELRVEHVPALVVISPEVLYNLDHAAGLLLNRLAPAERLLAIELEQRVDEALEASVLGIPRVARPARFGDRRGRARRS